MKVFCSLFQEIQVWDKFCFTKALKNIKPTYTQDRTHAYRVIWAGHLFSRVFADEKIMGRAVVKSQNLYSHINLKRKKYRESWKMEQS